MIRFVDLRNTYQDAAWGFKMTHATVRPSTTMKIMAARKGLALAGALSPGPFRAYHTRRILINFNHLRAGNKKQD